MQTAPDIAKPESLPGVADRLIAAGTAEFLRHGFEGASVSRIVQGAECNVRMIYHYFGNKLGLYRACIDRAYDRLRRAEAAAGFWDLPPREAIAELVRFTFDYMQDNPEFQGLMRIENMADGVHVRGLNAVNTRAAMLFAAIDRVIRRGVAAGDFADPGDAGLLYLSILGLSTIHIQNRHTMGVVLGRDLSDPGFLRARREEVVRIVLASLRRDRA
ncbi:TetR family transcriptional regulator [uncultured Paracoccus sp.]|uniref:TetR family transcriptional regulator n=1 Tax=uncultured Paracoccus sp. TaxID=189685 RepID=UPI0025E41A78|nr:TetR family transcriptional regulator [uncultured Paracoccus sp.]